MDQSSHSRLEGFTNNALFNGSQHQQFNNAYDNLLHSNGADQSSYDNTWDANNGNYGLQQPRTQAPQGWASHGTVNHSLHGQIGNVSGQPSPYVRSISQSPGPYGPYPYNNTGQQFQYQQSQPQYDPALFQSSHAQNFNRGVSNYSGASTGTIAPQALQNEVRSANLSDRSAFPTQTTQPNAGAFANNVVDQQKLINAIPAGADAGLFSIIDFDQLSKATSTTRMGNYANVGQTPWNWDCNRATLPQYVPRRSRNELRQSAGNDSRLLAKIGKKSTKLQRIAAAPKSVQAASFAAAHPSEKIKYEGDITSSDEESSSDDDESSYTSDEEAEAAPLPSKRPTGAVGGTEYDTIKAVWRSKRRGVSGDSIRKGLVDSWEITKTIRDRWKADDNAYQEAKKKGQKSQLPLLESRVKDQRDMIEAAFKAVLKHGHPSIVSHMSENESLIYVCYQFLLERVKAEDYNSPLSHTILELMTSWTTLTEERVEKTHLVKVLARFSKLGNARTKHWVNKINANAVVASKEVKGKATDKKEGAASAKAASPTQRHAESVAGVKRAASTTAGEGTAAKKIATGMTKPYGTTASTKPNSVAKKTPTTAETAKAAAAGPTGVTKTKSVAAKPSGIFSSLSAAKKPGTSTLNKSANAATASKLAEKKATASAPKSTFSFAETMANLAKPKQEEKPAQQKPEKQLPPETPEEKGRRLRKESRRHLRVSFKREDELTEVRYFTHDPDEELGHDASQMRDVSDVGGEGRMLKQQHQMMDEDEEDEAVEEAENAMAAFPKEIGLIDFSDVDKEERNRNYEHRGGGKLEVESKERVNRDYYDANNLIVFYTTPDDIPPNPREPANPYSGDDMENVRNIGSPGEEYAVRARAKRTAQFGAQQQHYPQQATQTPPQFDFSKLQGLMSQQPPNMQQPQQSSSYATPDINSILASLTKGNPNMPTPPPPQMGAGLPQGFKPQPVMSGMQPPPPQPQQQQQQQASTGITPDLASLLASLSNQQQQPQAAMGDFGAPLPPPQMNFGQQFGSNAWGQQQQGQSGQQQQRGDNRMTPESRANPLVNSKYRTKVCNYWQKGTCQKGDGCSYKHSND